MTLSGAIPNLSGLCGVSAYLPLLEVDPGAVHGASFTPGLRHDLGS